MIKLSELIYKRPTEACVVIVIVVCMIIAVPSVSLGKMIMNIALNKVVKNSTVITDTVGGVNITYYMSDSPILGKKKPNGMYFKGKILINEIAYKSKHKNALLAHEYYHYLNNDEPGIIYNLMRTIKIEPKCEIEADSYSIMLTSKEEVLELIKEVDIWNYFRIKRIKNS